MYKKKIGKNRGVWCGEVVRAFEYSHEEQDNRTGEVESLYTGYVKTVIRNKSEVVIDDSILPVTVSQKTLEALEKPVEVGNIVFLKGAWHARKGEDGAKVVQTAFAKVLEVHEDYPVKTRNKFEFEGLLVSKLFEVERDEKGNLLKDEQGKLIPRLVIAADENGDPLYEDGVLVRKKLYTVRENKEKKIVNDYKIAIGSDYIHCISYGKLARYIAQSIEEKSKVKGSGYVRTREYKDGQGRKGIAYEAVVTTIEPLVEEEGEKGEQ